MPVEALDPIAADAAFDAAIDAPDVDTGLDAPVVQDDAPIADAEPTQVDAAPEIDGDGRGIPHKWRDQMKADSQLRDLYFRDAAAKKIFPDVPSMQAAADLMTEVGGREGVQALRSELEAVKEIDSLFEAGDPRAVQKFVEQSPEGFAKLAPSMLQQYARIAPEEFNRTACAIVSQSINDAGIMGQLTEMNYALQYGRPEKAIEILGEVVKNLGAFGQLASQAPAQQQPNAKFQERETALNQREQQMFAESLNSAIVAVRDPMIANLAKPHLGKLELNEYQQAALRTAVVQELGKKFNSDPDVLKKYRAAVAKKNQADAVSVAKGKMDNVLPDIVRDATRKLFGPPKTGKEPTRAGNAAQTTPAGWTAVQQVPSPSTINHRATTDDMKMDGKFILNDGRRVVYQAA